MTKTILTLNIWQHFQSRKRLYNHQCPSVRLSAKPLNSFKSLSFIIHNSSFFIHPLSFFIILHSSFIILHSFLPTFKLFSLFVFIHYHFLNTITGHYLSQVITLMIVLIFPIISNSHKIKFLIPNFIHWSTNLTNDLIAKVNQSLNFPEKFQSCNLGKLIRTICWAYIFYNNKCLPSKERKRNIFFWVSLLYLLSDYIG